MIALDTSALIAWLGDETQGPMCREMMENADIIVVSAATISEALIVSTRKGLLDEATEVLNSAAVKIIDLTPERARLAAAAYARWGKSFHPAALNFGDCFSYATAREFDCPLLYVGEDFSRTDVRRAIASPHDVIL